MLAGGPLGVLDGGPLGVLDGGPVPEDAAEEPGAAVAVGGGDTLEQNWATVSFCALASAVSCGKLFWALLEAPLLLVPLSAAAQAVHCPKAFELGADPLPFCPLAWLFAVAAPPAVGEP